MKIGTKSILFGAHCFFIHPIFVFIAWWKLYGFPFDIRLWVSFFVHDLGYWGKSNMDGTEGKTHPEFGANIMYKLFDKFANNSYDGFHNFSHKTYYRKWYYFTLYHSRYLARKENNREFSKLCVADKLAISLTPIWIFLPLTILTGEIKEYIEIAKNGKDKSIKLNTESKIKWYKSVQKYLKEWAYTHKDNLKDTWT